MIRVPGGNLIYTWLDRWPEESPPPPRDWLPRG
jgi:hypothetical protein